MKTLLVTGSEGFVGTHLIKTLADSDYKVVPACLPQLIPKKGKYVPLDILNLDLTIEVFKNHEPDIILHLAAISSVAKSFRDRPIAYDTNIMGTVHLLEAARSLNKKIRFINISTCEVYGGGDNLSEDAKINLKNPYAVSKYITELICYDYLSEGVECVVLRPFTHTGPGQAEVFVLPTIAKQIAEIEKGKRPPLIELGNIEARREFINVTDITHAYSLALENCNPGEIYNISSSQGYSIAQLIDIYKKFAKKTFDIKINPSKLRKVDIPVLIGNGHKFSNLTGWKPKIKIEKTLEDILNYWRAKV